MKTNPEFDSLIDAMGGTGKLAARCGVTPQAVSQWRIKGIPPARRMYLELVYKKVFRDHAERRAS